MRCTSRSLFLLISTLLVVLPVLALAAERDDSPTSLRETMRGYARVSSPAHSTHVSTGSPSLGKRAGEGFYIYGGPESLEGDFQIRQVSSPPLVPAFEGWAGVDLTQTFPYWQRSTFNAELLGAHFGEGNHAMWCGWDTLDPGQDGGWMELGPGYGNHWAAALEFSMPDPTEEPVLEIHLDFYFHMETEPGYDFFSVQYDSVGQWITVHQASGTNKGPSGFEAPGLHFAELGANPMIFTLPEGTGGEDVHLRLLFESDGTGSDEDGLWPTEAGAVQVDDLVVSIMDAGGLEIFLSEEDFEDPEGPYDWTPITQPLAGDFAKVFPAVSTLPSCYTNYTPVAGFVDDGTPPSNDPLSSTGGALSSTWSYGVDGGWVVNGDGGLAAGTGSLVTGIHNEIWSPLIDFDLPQTFEDDEMTGLELGFRVWNHLPMENGIFYTWRIRYGDGQYWTPWNDHGELYYSENDRGQWEEVRIDVSDTILEYLVNFGPLYGGVQIALGVIDLSEEFGLPGLDSTPSPFFDDVSLYKYPAAGPSILVREAHLFQDRFTPTGMIEVDDPEDRDEHDCPVDIAWGLQEDLYIDPGDSLVAQVRPTHGGALIDPEEILLHWVLDVNPLFELDIRENLLASGALLGSGSSPLGWDQWAGTVVAEPVVANGVTISDRYSFDLPDEDFAYPGDVLRYHLQATERIEGVPESWTSTLPAETAFFPDGAGITGEFYDPLYTAHFLPTLLDLEGTTPPILVVYANGHRGGRAQMKSALQQLGFQAGTGFDSYTVLAPGEGHPNHLGSSWGNWDSSSWGPGAVPETLSGYSLLLYQGGDLEHGVLSIVDDPSDRPYADDFTLLQLWQEMVGPKGLALFGSGLVHSVATDGVAGEIFLEHVMGVQFLGGEFPVGNPITSSMRVLPSSSLPVFDKDFVIHFPCFGASSFDWIDAIEGQSFRCLEFAPPYDDSFDYSVGAAGVFFEPVSARWPCLHPTTMTFPFGLETIRQGEWVSPERKSVLAALLQDILDIVHRSSTEYDFEDGGLSDWTPMEELLVELTTPE